MADVPAAMNTSQVHAVDAAFRSAGDSDSPNQTTPGRASPPQPGHVARLCRQRHAFVAPRQGAATVPAGKLPDRSVQPHETLRSRAYVQVVHVLRDDGARLRVSRPLREHVVRRVRLARGDRRATPLVPLPHQCRIARERFRRSEILGAERSPQTTGATKRRDTARCRYAGTCQHRHASRLSQASSQLLEHVIILVVRARYCLP